MFCEIRNMKILILFVLFSFFISFDSSATTFIVKDPKTATELLSTEMTIHENETLGSVTVEQFEKAVRHKSLTYKGDESAILSINEIGSELKVISNREMKAYGWCFKIDGFIPETMPDQTFLNGNEINITWFYGYAHYLNGKWVGQCLE